MTVAERAWEEGFEAGRNGTSINNNPYPNSETMHLDEARQAWFDGYEAAAEEARR